MLLWQTPLFAIGYGIVTASLVAEWRFNDGSGQQLTDYSGNGHHCQLGPTSGSDTNEPTWTSTGLSFPGETVANGYCKEAGAFVTSDGIWSAAFAVKIPDQNDNRIFSEGNLSASNPIVAFGSGPTGDTDHIRLWMRNASNVVVADFRATNFVTCDNTWRFVAIVVNGTNAKIFTDGNSQSGTITGGSSSVDMMAIGTMAFNGAYSTSAALLGDIAWGATYSSALADADIAALRLYARDLLGPRGITLP